MILINGEAMKNKLRIKSYHIAPCGMNCGICLGYLREKNKCLGCRREGINKPHHCAKCIIRKCKNMRDEGSTFCYKCKQYPCQRLKRLDKRYKTKYNMSMIENLEFIKEFGIRKFVKQENKRWKCEKCGGVVCIHRGFCLNCNNK